MYLAGEPMNERDFVFRRIKEPRARQSILVELKPAPEIESGALSGTFDIVLGRNLLKT